MSTGIMPTTMKSALVTPSLKKQSLDMDVMNKNNFRPISNLSFILKLTGNVVRRRLIDHVSSSKLHEQFQSAYKPNHRTETALTKIQNDILVALDNKSAVVLVLQDLPAAIDSVNRTLLACMKTTGVVIDVAHQ